GLTGAKPDLPDDKVLEFLILDWGFLIGRVRGYNEIAADGGGGEGVEGEAPVAGVVGGGGVSLVAEGDGDVGVGFGGAPDGDRTIALQDGVVGKEWGHGERGGGCGGDAGGCGDDRDDEKERGGNGARAGHGEKRRKEGAGRENENE